MCLYKKYISHFIQSIHISAYDRTHDLGIPRSTSWATGTICVPLCTYTTDMKRYWECLSIYNVLYWNDNKSDLKS